MWLEKDSNGLLLVSSEWISLSSIEFTIFIFIQQVIWLLLCTKAERVIVIATGYRMQPVKTTTEQNPSNQYLLDTYQKFLHLTKV